MQIVASRPLRYHSVEATVWLVAAIGGGRVRVHGGNGNLDQVWGEGSWW